MEEGVLEVSPSFQPLLLQRFRPGEDQCRQILLKLLVKLQPCFLRQSIGGRASLYRC